jgi:hypothetical protein
MEATDETDGELRVRVEPGRGLDDEPDSLVGRGPVVGALADDWHEPHENRKSPNQPDHQSEARERRQQAMEDRGEVENHRRAMQGFTDGPAG